MMTFFAPTLRCAAGFFGDEDTCARGVHKLKYIAEEALIGRSTWAYSGLDDVLNALSTSRSPRDPARRR